MWLEIQVTEYIQNQSDARLVDFFLGTSLTMLIALCWCMRCRNSTPINVTMLVRRSKVALIADRQNVLAGPQDIS